MNDYYGEAHVSEVAHEEEASDVAEISPVYVLGAVLLVAIFGFIAWKFLLKK